MNHIGIPLQIKVIGINLPMFLIIKINHQTTVTGIHLRMNHIGIHHPMKATGILHKWDQNLYSKINILGIFQIKICPL